MRNWPLRLRMTLWTVTVGGVSLLVFGVIIGGSLRRAMIADLDSTLRAEAESVMRGLVHRPKPLEWEDEAQVRGFFSKVVTLYSFEVEQPMGTVVYRSRNLGNFSIPTGPDDQPYAATVGKSDVARILQLTSGTIRLRVAVDLSPIQNWEQTMWLTYAFLLPATLALIAWGGNWLSGKALKPVDDIAATVEQITAERLDQRLPVSSAKDEVGHLTTVLNRMIDRLQQSFEQARRFSADASHELKTPLTILRGEIEIALRSGDLPPAVEKTMLNLLEETERLVHIVEGLLLLSRADSGKLDVGKDAIPLTGLIAELAEDIEILAGPKGIAVETKLTPGIFVAGSAQFLRQLVLNLFDNAIKYNVVDGKIRVELSTAGDQAVFSIANTGIEISPEHRERIFVRFFRAESSRRRDRSRGGQGLGLSICQEIARAHGGTLAIEPSEPGWTAFRFSLPLRPKGGGRPVETARHGLA